MEDHSLQKMWSALLLTSFLGLVAVSDSIDPIPVNAKAGQSVELPCYAVDPITSACEYMWSKTDDQGTTTIYRHRANVTIAAEPRVKYDPQTDALHWHNMTILSLDERDTATYKCFLVCMEGTFAAYSLNVEVDQASLEYMHVTAGDRVKLECFNPYRWRDTEAWYKDDGASVQQVFLARPTYLPYVSEPGKFMAEIDYMDWNNLILKSAEVEDSMVYRCESYGLGIDPDRILREVGLFVHAASPEKEELTVKSGESVIMRCAARYPDPKKTIEWRRVLEKSNETLYTSEAGAKNHIASPQHHEVNLTHFWHDLTIKGILEGDSGLYQCVQTEPFFYVIKEVELTVGM